MFLLTILFEDNRKRPIGRLLVTRISPNHYFLMSLIMKITKQDPITPPMIFPISPEISQLPNMKLNKAPPTSPMITLIYQGKELFMI